MEQTTFQKDALETAEVLKALDIIFMNSGPISQEQGYAILRKKAAIAHRFLETHIKDYSETPYSGHVSQQANDEQ